MAKREYVLRVVRDEDFLYMPPHPYRVGTGQPFETLVRLLINESYDPNITVEIISERPLSTDVEPEGHTDISPQTHPFT